MSLGQTSLDLGNFLTWLSRRQEAISSNIANADTPGYKTRDVAAPASFSSMLQDLSPVTEETPGLASRNDGNNVSMDREARLLSENAMRFNMAAQMIRGELRDIRSAIEEGRSS